MNSDLEIITRTYPADYKILRVYAIGDVHVGSREFNEEAIRKKIDIIKNDPVGVVSICGDLADYGLKNSKTNVYEQTMNPKAQQEYVFELFKPIADKMIACVPGNHEGRITREVGLCPMYDLCVLWGVPEVFRENMAITRLNFGKIRGEYQNSFVILTTHGSTRNKHKKFIACFDGLDAAISGHTHTPSYTPHGKIKVHNHGSVATHVSYKELVVDANLEVGGYSVKNEYEIPPRPELQYLELSSYRTSDRKRHTIKTIDYHSIQI